MAVNTNPVKIKEILERGVEDVIIKEHLETALKSGKQLRVKFGIDPTGPKIHLGRAVSLRKLKAFQELGHQIVLIIGDFTATIGDPSDKLAKRPMLLKADIERNMKTYAKQLAKILDMEKVELRYNSEWLGGLRFAEISALADSFSLQQMAARRNFKDRIDKGEEVSMREMLYPLMQGYDSVEVKADVEVGGFDQLFNVKAGRAIQKQYGQPEQDILTTQMLEGTDGRKMSTSWGNVITIVDEPNDMFGKIMSIKDELILKYFWLCTDVLQDELDGYQKRLEKGANPKDIKAELGKKIVALYHSEKDARKAADDFEKKFSKKESSTEIKEVKFGGGSLKAVLVMQGMSGAAAVRLAEGGSVSVNGTVTTDWNIEMKTGDVVQFGKKKETVKLVP
ncbi:tyrosine--tRNA ligase [Candidatus Azambacteria bacterium RIFCSPHIGHO2_02_FULL_52_12]|uniref:Tyrosine--tRNA ligase n=1 Tax=Candidatus Azambacteria bacterium RIFCSPLOWO2_01_FULL_46_25 TaxID=1797298 RepID=A0A1F5BV44_9BACT|nr:MAG: tyrosine--tRNA ligase [Candidatus Azambacteria bacterium RIFCSPHIGHO2_02_FULL_52_12]OGD34477.1 MAG: tyrosine--tRNA ligase [Candidatus Azambacteria bacterium RIFCSPLOWO2_01_FULL_46_25]OGD37594.1 MAG: tyrosine--tRNA ligase [Candidatus Azambacteria bacterium RIFCSPHIGHO2_01_FULL_51_74]